MKWDVTINIFTVNQISTEDRVLLLVDVLRVIFGMEKIVKVVLKGVSLVNPPLFVMNVMTAIVLKMTSAMKKMTKDVVLEMLWLLGFYIFV
jgi:hypothetical protein